MTTTINNLDSLRTHHAALQAALAEAMKPFGLTMQRQSASIDPSIGSLRITITTKFLPEGVADRSELDRMRWEEFAPAFGLPADVFGKVITLQGKEYAIAGLNEARTKNKIRIRRVEDGKMMLTTCENLRLILARA